MCLSFIKWQIFFNSIILSSFTLVVTHPELQCSDLPEHFLSFPQVRTFSFKNSVSSHGNCISGISTANVLESAWKTAESLLLRPLLVTQPMYSILDWNGLKTLFKSLCCFPTKGKSQMENTGSPEDATGIKNSTASAGKLQIRMTHWITYALKSAKYQENLTPKDMPAKFLISTRPPKFFRERQSREQPL